MHGFQQILTRLASATQGKKLHQRKRKERADRIVRLLAAIEVTPELLESSYGWLTLTAETMKRSKATASRDFQLARRIHKQNLSKRPMVRLRFRQWWLFLRRFLH